MLSKNASSNFHHKKLHVILPMDICQGYPRNGIIVCRCCPAATTNIIDISLFRNVNPSKESMIILCQLVNFPSMKCNTFQDTQGQYPMSINAIIILELIQIMTQ